MEFTTREDIEAPIEHVFDQVTDFARFERQIMRRGGDIERVSQGDIAAVGTTWRVKFLMRGAAREVEAEIVTLDRPDTLHIAISSPSADAILRVDLVALSRARTRLTVTVKATAKSIPAKLMFQSLRFARQKSKARFDAIVADFAESVQTQYSA